MRKPTPKMLELLESMRRGVVVNYMAHMGRQPPYYYRVDTGKVCTSQALGLIDRGLAKHDSLRCELRLAPDGDACIGGGEG